MAAVSTFLFAFFWTLIGYEKLLRDGPGVKAAS
jgi:hypothetical protein